MKYLFLRHFLEGVPKQFALSGHSVGLTHQDICLSYISSVSSEVFSCPCFFLYFKGLEQFLFPTRNLKVSNFPNVMWTSQSSGTTLCTLSTGWTWALSSFQDLIHGRKGTIHPTWSQWAIVYHPQYCPRYTESKLNKQQIIQQLRFKHTLDNYFDLESLNFIYSLSCLQNLPLVTSFSLSNSWLHSSVIVVTLLYLYMTIYIHIYVIKHINTISSVCAMLFSNTFPGITMWITHWSTLPWWR